MTDYCERVDSDCIIFITNLRIIEFLYKIR